MFGCDCSSLWPCDCCCHHFPVRAEPISIEEAGRSLTLESILKPDTGISDMLLLFNQRAQKAVQEKILAAVKETL